MADSSDEKAGSGAQGPDEPELAQVRRRKKDEVREEREHRIDGAPEEEDDDEEPEPGVASWTPPPEMQAPTRRTGALRRLVLFILILAAAFLLVRHLATVVFAPDLSMGEALVPLDVVEPDEPVTLGVMAVNRRSVPGEAALALVREGEPEEPGPAVIVPADESVLVSIEAGFPPGDHVVTLVLYDLRRDGPPVGTVPGIPIRAGRPQLDVTDLRLPGSGRVGEEVELELTLANGTRRPERITPVVVFRDGATGRELEFEGPDLAVSPLDTVRTRFSVSPEGLGPGQYRVSVVVVTPRGDRAGAGVHGIPFELRD